MTEVEREKIAKALWKAEDWKITAIKQRKKKSLDTTREVYDGTQNR